VSIEWLILDPASAVAVPDASNIVYDVHVAASGFCPDHPARVPHCCV
jgi:hypothetical protein